MIVFKEKREAFIARWFLGCNVQPSRLLPLVAKRVSGYPLSCNLIYAEGHRCSRRSFLLCTRNLQCTAAVLRTKNQNTNRRISFLIGLETFGVWTEIWQQHRILCAWQATNYQIQKNFTFDNLFGASSACRQSESGYRPLTSISELVPAERVCETPGSSVSWSGDDFYLVPTPTERRAWDAVWSTVLQDQRFFSCVYGI